IGNGVCSLSRITLQGSESCELPVLQVGRMLDYMKLYSLENQAKLMLRKMQLFALSAMAIIVTFIATANASSFKWFIIYEPDIPDCIE
ncbi:MAG: cyclic lactone autoinducer peptide, partial [Syntrophomonas sp.]